MRQSDRRLINGWPWKLIAIVGIIAIILIVCRRPFLEPWQLVREGKGFAISGMAFVDKTGILSRFLIVHDNKNRGDVRLGILTLHGRDSIQYSPLTWPETIDAPVDLEALTAIPGVDKSFLALASGGTVYHLRLDISKMTVSVLKIFNLPDTPKDHNFEGLTLQHVGGKLLAAWGDRGGYNKPGRVCWGLFDPGTHSFTGVESFSFEAPWPRSPHVRHISDLKLDSTGTLFVASSSDPGDDGPFQSAVYMAGIFKESGNEIMFFRSARPPMVCQSEKHKIEALDIFSDKPYDIIVASDDENMGASVRRWQTTAIGLQ